MNKLQIEQHDLHFVNVYFLFLFLFLLELPQSLRVLLAGDYLSNFSALALCCAMKSFL